MRIFATLDELAGAKGEHLGHSEWHTVTQEQVNQFADATGDHQWIHVDTEKAAHGPFGTTIAHGYLTLSMIPFLGKVRFPATVPVGARVRAGVELVDLTDRPQGKQATFRWTVDVEGNDKPACVAETIAVYVP